MSDAPVPSPPDQPAAERPSARTDLRGYLADFETRMTRLQERAEDSQTRLEAVSASATSEGGEVTVTVGAGGTLTDIVFGPDMRRTSPQSMSDMVKETYRRAVQDAADQAKAAMTELLGEDTPAMDNFKSSLRRRGEGGER